VMETLGRAWKRLSLGSFRDVRSGKEQESHSLSLRRSVRCSVEWQHGMCFILFTKPRKLSKPSRGFRLNALRHAQPNSSITTTSIYYKEADFVEFIPDVCLRFKRLMFRRCANTHVTSSRSYNPKRTHLSVMRTGRQPLRKIRAIEYELLAMANVITRHVRAHSWKLFPLYDLHHRFLHEPCSRTSV
jgi:hypothetical protein